MENIKRTISVLGFSPKENTSGIYHKKYPTVDNYTIEVDVENESINYGDKIKVEAKTTLNFSQDENWVVLECVNRLLEKGYQPQNIILEKVYPAGHQHSGRLDICVTRDNGSEYLLIECKTYGKEFNREFSRMQKNGGQIFTYFKFSNKADVIMLYTSELKAGKFNYLNKIVKIEDDYRTGDVRDFYDKWNKLFKDTGIFESWVKPYNFESKALTPENLKEIKPEDSSFIFNQFLEILRHNVVSDKPNAFNKIFTLFLCKIFDEKNTKPKEELAFQWFYTPYTYEGKSYLPDDNISFQKRLTDLYKKGMKTFLEKDVTDISDADFDKKYGDLGEDIRAKLLAELTEIRLKKNNEFAIKEVFDDDSFEENAKVVKEIVELLQGYKIRYAAKQQYLSDFFELLLTTGLKQESGQFFTPVPIAQFIIKSLPVDKLLKEKLQKGVKDECLPFVIDYAAGSGHFITEAMHEIQCLLEKTDSNDYFGEAEKAINKAKDYPYDWAFDYIYGIEKDYRLVKVGKVGCYLHGDGLAQVIHSDGLANFSKTKDYKGVLLKTDKSFPQENKQFDIVVSNPPYSVSAFKNNASRFYGKDDFELYNSLTDNSSEIECLFVERTKQLLKDGGIAGIVLPSSILSNTGIYTKTREIILQYFEIIAITEFGSNTFMATGTNTVVLFLRRRNNYDSVNLKNATEKFFIDFQDVTLNGIEKPVAKYINHVWEGLSFADYLTLLQKNPNQTVESHELFNEYKNKFNATNFKKFWDDVVGIEKEKLFYFILAYPQRLTLVKTGEKNEEKRFLGYEFSNRRGNEGIHPMQRGKTIDECTQLFDPDVFENPQKASTYIYKAFNGDSNAEIPENLQKNISYQYLVDMLSFDRSTFEKNISLAVKKKVKIESKWDQVLFSNTIQKIKGSTRKIEKFNILESGEIPVITQEKDNIISGYSNEKDPITDVPVLLFGDHSCTLKYVDFKFFRGADGTVLLRPNDNFNSKYFYNVLKYSIFDLIENKEKYERHYKYLKNLYIPLPPKEIQEKIVAEIEVLEKKEEKAKEEIRVFEHKIELTLSDIKGELIRLEKSSPYVTKSIQLEEIPLNKYVTTDNMLQNKLGIIPFSGEPNISSITEYQTDDILISNIRPYLKKIWFADIDGGCSKDVLVFRTSNKELYLPKFLYYMMRRDLFFDYVMEGKKGVKMPRGNKDKILKYQIPVPPISEQQKIVAQIEEIENKIAQLENEIAEIPQQKEDILKKYLN